MAKQPAVSPHPAKFTKQDLELAAEDAREMMAGSTMLQNFVANMILVRRLYIVVRSALDNEIHHGWELDNAELILQTLVMSAETKANEKFKIADLQHGVFGTLVPLLDIILQQVQDTGQDIDGTEDFTPATTTEEESDEHDRDRTHEPV